jgi:hypothetical protein
MGQSNVSLANALTIVRSMLDEPNAAFWTNTELTTWLNEGCVDIQRRAEILRQEQNINIVVDQQSYDAPNDVHRIYRIVYNQVGSTLVYPLRYRGLEGMDQYWGNIPSLPSAFPYLYTLWYSPVGSGASPTPTANQLQIILYPAPAEAGSLTVFYYRLVVPVVASTDTLDITPGWEDIVYDYTVYKALRKDADPRWKDQQALYEQKLQDLIAVTRSFTDQPDYVTTGPSGTPTWLYGGGASW